MNLGPLLEQRAKRLDFYTQEAWQALQKPQHTTIVVIMQCLYDAPRSLSTQEIVLQLEGSLESSQVFTLHRVNESLHWQLRHGLVVHCGVRKGHSYWRLHDFGREVLACGSGVVPHACAPPRVPAVLMRRKWQRYNWGILDAQIVQLRTEGKKNVEIEHLLGLTNGAISSHERDAKKRAESVAMPL